LTIPAKFLLHLNTIYLPIYGTKYLWVIRLKVVYDAKLRFVYSILLLSAICSWKIDL